MKTIQSRLNRIRRALYPALDPVDGDTHWIAPRSMTRDRTTTEDFSEYVVTTTDGKAAVDAVLEKYKRHDFPTTLKYVMQDGKPVWEAGSFATGAWERSGEESMQHAYCFLGPDEAMHWHHHREWPVLHPDEHQNGSRTHGDPDWNLQGVFSKAGVEYEKRKEPQYVDFDYYIV